MKLVLEAKTSSKGIGNFKIWYKLLIYYRMNETFFVTKSFNWRRWSPSGAMLFFFEIGHSCFFSPAKSFCLAWQLWSVWSSRWFSSQEYFHFSFVIGVSVRDRQSSISIQFIITSLFSIYYPKEYFYIVCSFKIEKNPVRHWIWKKLFETISTKKSE